MNRTPSTVRIETGVPGILALAGEVAPYGPAPLALFWEGLTVPEIADGLGELDRRG